MKIQSLSILKVFRTFMLLAFIAVPSISSAGTLAYMWLEANGDAIPGDTTQTTVGGVDVTESIEISSFSLSGIRQTDGVTQTGKTILRPARILKRLDKASPLLFKALALNEAVTATILFFKPGSEGATIHYYTILLEDARIVGVMPSHDAVSTNPELETVSIAYQTITLTNLEGTSTEFTYNWTE